MPQSLHPDFETNPPETEYFFLGTGKIQVAIQWSRAEALTPLGLLISDPEHFCRKWSTHLFHPEFGLGKTQLTVRIDGVAFKPQHATTVVEWSEYNGSPAVRARWKAGKATVEEIFWCGEASAEVVREVSVEGAESEDVSIEAALYASNALLDWFGQSENGLWATGYAKISLISEAAALLSERTMVVVGKRALLRYAIGDNKIDKSYETHRSQLSASPNSDNFTKALCELFEGAATGLRAAVAESGRFDASIWQYNFEWSGDASHVCEALVYSGQSEVARIVLENILTRLSNDDGMVAESSRFRGGMDAELNSNGAVLQACQTYLDWTGDNEFLKEHFSRISAIADYLLRPEFLDTETHMLRSSRDIWERSARMGVRPGYDLSHQVYGVIGLDAVAAIAMALGEDGSRWEIAAREMRQSLLHHPTHSLIESGRFIKRRELNGAHQSSIQVIETESNREFLAMFRPKGTPMEALHESPWEPDACEVFPICYGLIEPESDVAKATMQEIELLWSQAWKGGGYGRYHVAAEPDSPGAWPFATAFIASAYLEMNDLKHSKRAIEWLIEKAGAAGSWFEFYGDRPTPPLPPTGIIVWGWAQYITLVVKHALGLRVVNDKLVAGPKLEGIEAKFRFRDSIIEIKS